MGAAVYDEDRAERLDRLIEAAAEHAAEGFRVDDRVIGWIIDGPRRIVLAEQYERIWLLAEVAVEGDGVYPEDDLAEEADLDLPAGYRLWWEDNYERAALARELGHNVSATALATALRTFRELADEIERRLVAVEGLWLQASPLWSDPMERGLLVPPR